MGTTIGILNTGSGTSSWPNPWNRSNINNASAFQQTGMDWLQAKARIVLEDGIAALRSLRIATYESEFRDYHLSRSNHPELPAPPAPVPAHDMLIEDDEFGNPQMIESEDLVCRPKVYVPASKPALGYGMVGPRYYPDDDEFFYALPGDTTPNLKKVPGPSSDGVDGVFQKRASLQSSPVQGGEIPGMFIRLPSPPPLR